MRPYAEKILQIIVALAALYLAAESSGESAEQTVSETKIAGEVTQDVPAEAIVVAASSAPVDVSEPVAEALVQRAPHSGIEEDLFKGHSWYTPPPPAPQRARPKTVKRGPVAPPLPFELLGSFQQVGRSKLYFLVKDDRIYDATIGDTLDDTYRLDGVVNGRLLFTYLPLNTSQGLRLGEQE